MKLTYTQKNCLKWLFHTCWTGIVLSGLISSLGFFSWFGISIVVGYIIGLCNQIYLYTRPKEKE